MVPTSGITSRSRIVAYEVGPNGRTVVAVRQNPEDAWLDTSECVPIIATVLENQRNIRTLEEFPIEPVSSWVEAVITKVQDSNVVLISTTAGVTWVADVEVVAWGNRKSFGFYIPGEAEPQTLEEFLEYIPGEDEISSIVIWDGEQSTLYKPLDTSESP